MTKKCVYCGLEISQDTQVCPRCNRAQPTDDNFRQTIRREDYGSYGHKPMPVDMPPRRNNTLLYVLIGVVVLAVSVIAYLMIENNRAANRRAETEREERERVEQERDELLSAQERAELAEQQRQDSIRAVEEGIRQRKQSLLAGYEKILQANPSERYLITDLNNNGFPELWITYDYGKHADSMIHVYHGEKGHPREIYKNYHNGYIRRMGNAVYVYLGDDALLEMKYNGNSVTENYLSDSEVNLPSSDPTYSTTNFGPLRNAFSF